MSMPTRLPAASKSSTTPGVTSRESVLGRSARASRCRSSSGASWGRLLEVPIWECVVNGLTVFEIAGSLHPARMSRRAFRAGIAGPRRSSYLGAGLVSAVDLARLRRRASGASFPRLPLTPTGRRTFLSAISGPPAPPRRTMLSTTLRGSSAFRPSRRIDGRATAPPPRPLEEGVTR
jgi:hypothetical protein